jgi:hypothetical protein
MYFNINYKTASLLYFFAIFTAFNIAFAYCSANSTSTDPQADQFISEYMDKLLSCLFDLLFALYFLLLKNLYVINIKKIILSLFMLHFIF